MWTERPLRVSMIDDYGFGSAESDDQVKITKKTKRLSRIMRAARSRIELVRQFDAGDFSFVMPKLTRGEQ